MRDLGPNRNILILFYYGIFFITGHFQKNEPKYKADKSTNSLLIKV